jgi:hypothetical protein
MNGTNGKLHFLLHQQDAAPGLVSEDIDDV